MASNPEDVIADIVQQMRTRAMVAGQASLEERDDALREAQEHEAYFLATACDALEAEVARLTAAQATPPANPTPQGPLTCESCGASDVYRCGCYDRCRCDHDRRSHTPHGICTHVGCACTNGLHGRGTWATPPATPEQPEIARLREEVATLRAENEALRDWRATVTASVQHLGGSFYEDVPKHIRELRAALTEAQQQRDTLREAAAAALREMCNTVAPRNSFTDAVDALDAALASKETPNGE